MAVNVWRGPDRTPCPRSPVCARRCRRARARGSAEGARRGPRRPPGRRPGGGWRSSRGRCLGARAWPGRAALSPGAPIRCDRHARLGLSWVKHRPQRHANSVGAERPGRDDLDDARLGPPPRGTREPSSSSIDRARGDPAGCTTAVPWKLMVAGGNGRHQRQDPAPAHWNSHGDPAVGCHVPGLPAAGCDRDEQPLAAGLVHHAAGPGFPARGDVTEHGERRPGDRPPYLLTGQPGLGCLSWSWIVLVAMTAPPAENAAIWPATIDASTRYHLAPESPGPHRRDLRP